jgi:hypothetical protein
MNPVAINDVIHRRIDASRPSLREEIFGPGRFVARQFFVLDDLLLYVIFPRYQKRDIANYLSRFGSPCPFLFTLKESDVVMRYPDGVKLIGVSSIDLVFPDYGIQIGKDVTIFFHNIRYVSESNNFKNNITTVYAVRSGKEINEYNMVEYFEELVTMHLSLYQIRTLEIPE